MLQFFGSPLGQKVAAEMPKILKKCSLQLATCQVRRLARRGRNFTHRIQIRRPSTPLLDVGAGNKARIPMVRLSRHKPIRSNPDPA